MLKRRGFKPIFLIKTDCGFWLQWILVTLAGFLISLCWIEIDVRPHIKATEGADRRCNNWFWLKE